MIAIAGGMDTHMIVQNLRPIIPIILKVAANLPSAVGYTIQQPKVVAAMGSTIYARKAVAQEQPPTASVVNVVVLMGISSPVYPIQPFHFHLDVD
jgi:hypothetical protein